MQSINYFQINWFCFYVFSFLFLLKFLFKKFHWSFALAISYTLLQTYAFGQWVELRNPYSYMFNLILKEHHQEAFIITLLCLFLILYVKIELKYFGWLCVTNILVTICLLPFHVAEHHMIGLSVNPAMNASITAITLPFLFFLPNILVMPFLTTGVILIICTKQFTPILAVIVAFLGPSFIESEKKVRNFSILIILSVLFFLLFHNKNNVSDRLINWELFGRYWWNHYNVLIGSGNGSFNLWGPWIQHQNVASDEMWFKKWLPQFGQHFGDFQGHAIWYWLWLHSDIYQTLFEMGVVGLAVWTNSVIHVLYRMKRHEALFSGALAWLTVACFYYPLHFPVQLLLGVFLISFAIKK